LPAPPHPDQLYIMQTLPGLEVYESKENGHRVYTYLGYVVPRIEGTLEERCMGTIFWLAGAQEAKEFEDEQEAKKSGMPAAAAKPAKAAPAKKAAAPKKTSVKAAAPKKSLPAPKAKAAAKKAAAVAAKRK
jgi:hypothetical protein